MAKFVNRAKMTTATTGTGAITLGSAVDGYQTFAAAGLVDTDVVRYAIEDGNAWEIGTGTYTAAGTTLSRNLQESSTGSLLNLSGDAVVYVTAAAEDVVNTSGSTMTGPLDVQSTITADGLTVDGGVAINGGDILIQNTAGTNYLRFYEDVDFIYTPSNTMDYDPFFDQVSTTAFGTAGVLHYLEADPGDGETTDSNISAGFINHTSVNSSVVDTTNDFVYGFYNYLTHNDNSEFSGRLLGSANVVTPNLTKASQIRSSFEAINAIEALPASSTSSIASVLGSFNSIQLSPADTSTNSSVSITNLTSANNRFSVICQGADMTYSITSATGLNIPTYLSQYGTGNSTFTVGTYKAVNAMMYTRDLGTSTATTPLSVGNGYGFYLDNGFNATGAYGNFYGLYLEDFTPSVAGLNYAIYAAGGDTYLNGNVETTGNITVAGNVDGRDIAADGTKLDGIEAGADVTDATNVAAAGAAMTSGATMTGDLSFGDNIKANFGASSDLQIYHDGGNSFIDDVGTGRLYIRASDGIHLANPSNALYLSTFDTGNLVLYYNGAAKLATTSTGVDVTGNIALSGTVDGRDVAADGTKLDGIEAGADVTDAANVEPLVDAHLNTSTATTGQVLSWNGTDYGWSDQASGGGGISNGRAIAVAMVFG